MGLNNNATMGIAKKGREWRTFLANNGYPVPSLALICTA
jgi:hypothetical protein